MILNQVFKTREGAVKRAAFENAHPNPDNVRCYRWRALPYGDGTWRVEKIRDTNRENRNDRKDAGAKHGEHQQGHR